MDEKIPIINEEEREDGKDEKKKCEIIVIASISFCFLLIAFIVMIVIFLLLKKFWLDRSLLSSKTSLVRFDHNQSIMEKKGKIKKDYHTNYLFLKL